MSWRHDDAWLSARPSGRVERPKSDAPGSAATDRDFASGTVASPKRRHRSEYITTARLHHLSESLGPVDWQLLDTVHRFRLCTGAQLTMLGFGSGDAALRAGRRTLLRLTEAGVIVRLDRRIGGVRSGSSGFIYRLGPAGQRLLGEKRAVLDEPGLHHLQHTLGVTAVFVRLKAAERAGQLSAIRFDPEPSCWRPFLGPHGQPDVLKPDGFAELRIDDRRRLWFIEVDRGTVSTASLRRKLERYRDYLATGKEQDATGGVFPRVVWDCTDARRVAHLKQLFEDENERLGAELHRHIDDEWTAPTTHPPP